MDLAAADIVVPSLDRLTLREALDQARRRAIS
jgi:hypothetical protein